MNFLRENQTKHQVFQ